MAVNSSCEKGYRQNLDDKGLRGSFQLRAASFQLRSRAFELPGPVLDGNFIQFDCAPNDGNYLQREGSVELLKTGDLEDFFELRVLTSFEGNPF